jgi:hypothetical protein
MCQRKQSAAAVATSREGDRSQRQAGQGRIDDEELMAGVQIPKIPPFTTCNFMRTCELGA